MEAVQEYSSPTDLIAEYKERQDKIQTERASLLEEVEAELSSIRKGRRCQKTSEDRFYRQLSAES